MQNLLLAALKPRDAALLASHLETVSFRSGEVLFEPGDDVTTVCFPAGGSVASIVLCLRDGGCAETAMIGREGALGGIISEGAKPAFARGIVQIGGPAFRLSVEFLERAKQKSPRLRDHFARYADCFLAQLLQSVACNAVHALDARLARWLLSLQDRLGTKELHVTQEFISQMLGVQRPYTSRVVGELETRGGIKKSRGTITITNRRKLERQVCECYGYLRRHFDRVLPGVYPRYRP